jgi:hypothetical protein
MPLYKDINKVFRETKVKLANILEEGIVSWGKNSVGYLLLQKHCLCPKKSDGSSNTLFCPVGWPVRIVGSRFTHIIWPACCQDLDGIINAHMVCLPWQSRTMYVPRKLLGGQ